MAIDYAPIDYSSGDYSTAPVFQQYAYPARILTRSEVAPYYYFWVIDSNGDIVGTNSGTPPTTSFPDVITGLTFDASYTFRAQTRARYHNTDIIYGETILNFDLDGAGSVTVKQAVPNIPFNLKHELTPNGGVSFNWQYDPTGELSTPTEYVIYVNDVETDTVPYFRTTTSRGTLSALPEAVTLLEVSARSLTGESVRVSVSFTPDSTPPDSPAVYLQIV
jgi:hypothetical protein